MQLRPLVFAVATAAFVSAILAGCTSATDLRLVEDESFLTDFEVNGEDVYIRCHLVIENSAAEGKTFRLDALVPEDVEGGLLEEERLIGYDESLDSATFTVEGDSSAALDVVFVGEFAGTNLKQDRLLPEIIITPVGQ